MSDRWLATCVKCGAATLIDKWKEGMLIAAWKCVHCDTVTEFQVESEGYLKKYHGYEITDPTL